MSENVEKVQFSLLQKYEEIRKRSREILIDTEVNVSEIRYDSSVVVKLPKMNISIDKNLLI